MNQELKAMIDIAFDAVAIGKDAIGKDYFDLMKDIAKVVADTPSVIMHVGDLLSELKGLITEPGALEDLIVYVEQKFSVGREKAVEIVDHALKVTDHVLVALQHSKVIFG
jgi:hypothetical protein